MRDYNDLPDLELQLVETETQQDDTFDIPLDISDILTVCKQYSLLGWNIQQQIEAIVELGITDAIDAHAVSTASLPHIRSFLKQVIANPLFGDAVDQATETVRLIDDWQELHPTSRTLN